MSACSDTGPFVSPVQTPAEKDSGPLIIMYRALARYVRAHDSAFRSPMSGQSAFLRKDKDKIGLSVHYVVKNPISDPSHQPNSCGHLFASIVLFASVVTRLSSSRVLKNMQKPALTACQCLQRTTPPWSYFC